MRKALQSCSSSQLPARVSQCGHLLVGVCALACGAWRVSPRLQTGSNGFLLNPSTRTPATCLLALPPRALPALPHCCLKGNIWRAAGCYAGIAQRLFLATIRFLRRECSLDRFPGTLDQWWPLVWLDLGHVPATTALGQVLFVFSSPEILVIQASRI